jgi:hypothetical protein
MLDIAEGTRHSITDPDRDRLPDPVKRHSRSIEKRLRRAGACLWQRSEKTRRGALHLLWV